MKIRRAGAKLFHAERRTEITKFVVTFLNFSRKRLKSKMKFVRLNLCRETQANWNTRFSYFTLFS